MGVVVGTAVGASGMTEQIRLMLESTPPSRMSVSEFDRLDAVMQRQRERHGAFATSWWFERGARDYWSTMARTHVERSVGSVAR